MPLPGSSPRMSAGLSPTALDQRSFQPFLPSHEAPSSYSSDAHQQGHFLSDKGLVTTARPPAGATPPGVFAQDSAAGVHVGASAGRAPGAGLRAGRTGSGG